MKLELLVTVRPLAADSLCVGLPRCASEATGWNLLQMGVAAVLKPVVEAEGIDLA